MTPVALGPREVCDLIPQQAPFRFVDRIVEVDADRIVGEYTYRDDEFFYPGHFPAFPVTPGVVLLETMCQTAFALAIYLLAQETSLDVVRSLVMMTTESQVEYTQFVRPGSSVRATASKIFWRRRKLKAAVELLLPDGTLLAHGVVAGMGVARGS
jgi:3-hydroxyacyl-[acyl-carrier-protein] dehydratase